MNPQVPSPGSLAVSALETTREKIAALSVLLKPVLIDRSGKTAENLAPIASPLLENIYEVNERLSSLIDSIQI